MKHTGINSGSVLLLFGTVWLALCGLAALWFGVDLITEGKSSLGVSLMVAAIALFAAGFLMSREMMLHRRHKGSVARRATSEDAEASGGPRKKASSAA